MQTFSKYQASTFACKRVVAVVISFNSQEKELFDLLTALLPQVARAILVDNHSTPDAFQAEAFSCFDNLEIVSMKENVGIAAAQNVGIERAIELNADFIFLSDQDSIASPTLIADLLAAITVAQQDTKARPVAAAGPATIDLRTGHISFFVTERRGVPGRWQPSIVAEHQPDFVEVAFLIASGTLIPTDVINQIGGMRSNYFIDHVDTEWSFRAINAGYRLLGVPGARLGHQLGDSVSKVWFFGMRQVAYHSPLRDYYMFRNTILMLRDTPMTLIWKLHFLWRLMQFAGYFLVFSSERGLRIKKMMLGLCHALTGVSGRLEITSGNCHAIETAHFPPRADS